MNKTTHINLLSKETQNIIRSMVEEFLINKGIKGEELEEAIDTAMSGRLCDVEEMVDIDEILW